MFDSDFNDSKDESDGEALSEEEDSTKKKKSKYNEPSSHKVIAAGRELLKRAVSKKYVYEKMKVSEKTQESF